MWLLSLADKVYDTQLKINFRKQPTKTTFLTVNMTQILHGTYLYLKTIKNGYLNIKFGCLMFLIVKSYNPI